VKLRRQNALEPFLTDDQLHKELLAAGNPTKHKRQTNHQEDKKKKKKTPKAQSQKANKEMQRNWRYGHMRVIALCIMLPFS